MRKRDFLAGLGVTAAGISQALAQAASQVSPKGKDLGAVAPPPPRKIPHRKVSTKNLFKVPSGYPNGVAVVPEGVWVGEQKAAGYGQSGKHEKEAAVRLERQEAQDGDDRFLQHLGHDLR